MHTRSKAKKSILILGAFLAALIVFGNDPQAGAIDPNIIFESSPLFKEVNFLPGQSIARWVRVRNSTQSVRTAAAKVSNFSDPETLGGQMYFVIQKSGVVVYSKTLADFLNAGEVVLSSINPGETVQYDFYVVFKAQAGAVYMSKSLTFDLLVGFTDGQAPAGLAANGFAGGGSNSGLAFGPSAFLSDNAQPSSVPSDCETAYCQVWQTACVDGLQYCSKTYSSPALCRFTDKQVRSFKRNCAKEQVLGVKRYPNGSLLRAPNKKIYLVTGGKLKLIKTLKELRKYRNKKIYDVGWAVIEQYKIIK